MNVTVLRLGHRYSRDKRMSTHVALTARALGACEVVFDSVDSGVKRSVEAVNNAWGGGFKVSFTGNWKKFVSGFDGEVVHLTMYGLNLNDVCGSLRSSGRDKLVVVGSQKVPAEMYGMADYNVAVGNQPHSEVAALAVFLDRLYAGEEIGRAFGGRKTIVPQSRGKKIVENG